MPKLLNILVCVALTLFVLSLLFNISVTINKSEGKEDLSVGDCTTRPEGFAARFVDIGSEWYATVNRDGSTTICKMKEGVL